MNNHGSLFYNNSPEKRPEGPNNKKEKAQRKEKFNSGLEKIRGKIRNHLGAILTVGVLAGLASPKPTFDSPIPPVTIQKKESKSPDYLALEKRFGSKATEFALEAVENGKMIKEHPDRTKTLEKFKKLAFKKYSKHITPLDLFDLFNEKEEAINLAAIYAATDYIANNETKYHYKLPVELVVATLAKEGHSLDKNTTDYKNLEGYHNYGTDTFGSEFDKMVELGLIPAEFKENFTPKEVVNESKEKVTTATFKTPEAAKQAVVAMLAYNQHLFFEDLKRKNINPENFSDEEVYFYTYFYYNCGPNRKDSTLVTEQDFHKYYKDKKHIGIKRNSYRVAGSAKWLQKSAIFQTKDKSWYKSAEKKS